MHFWERYSIAKVKNAVFHQFKVNHTYNFMKREPTYKQQNTDGDLPNSETKCSMVHSSLFTFFFGRVILVTEIRRGLRNVEEGNNTFDAMLKAITKIFSPENKMSP